MIAILVVTQGDNPAEPNCPVCGSKQEAYTAFEAGTKPAPGDASICWYCAAVCVFTDDLHLRIANEEETARILENPMVREMLDVIPEIQKHKRKES